LFDDPTEPKSCKLIVLARVDAKADLTILLSALNV
jgi:hypothetical protein